MLQIFRSVVDDPLPRFSSIGAGTIATAPTRRSRRQQRPPELHRRPRTGSCEQQPAIKRKRMATSTSSRSADQAARAGRSASQLPGIGAPRARVRAANVVNAARFHRSFSAVAAAARARASASSVSAADFPDLLSMTPYLALARSAPAPSSPLRAGEANVRIDSPELHRRPEPEAANNNPR